MAANTIPEKNRAADLSAQAADFLPKLWNKGVEIAEQNTNFFEQFEGKTDKSPIWSKTDLAKGAGQTMIFRTMAGLYGDGVIGDEIIADNTEDWKVGQYTLEVDYLRHATSYTMRTQDRTAMLDEIESGIPAQLGEWLGRKKTERLMMMFRESGSADNYIFANNKPDRESLKSADTVTMDNIVTWGQMLKTRGAAPAMVGKSDAAGMLKRFICLSTGEGLVSLQTSSDYKQAVRDGGIRGDENYIFKGGFADVNGHVIKEYQPIDHDGYGAVGSAMNPKAFLGVAITAANTAQDITGGGSATAGALTAPKYFEFFSEYAYRFTPANILTAPGTTRYCLIYNLSGADKGKMGFYSYVVNNGNKLVMTGRLRAAASGIAVTTLGNVTWNTGAWANKHTDAHPSGSLIIETNSYGVPFGYSIMMGARAALRGYGRFQNKRTEELMDGEFVKKVFITSIFGQAPTKRADLKCNGFLVAQHAISYAGISLPTIT